MSVNGMKVLQIANGYLDKPLYRHLFDHMDRKTVENVVFVPVAKADKRESNRPDVLVRPCFSSLDRRLYFPKQWKTLRAIVASLAPQLQSFSLTHSHTVFSTGCASLKLKRKFGIPYVVAVRDTDVNLFFAKYPFMRGLGNTILREAARVVFLSPAYADFVREKYVRPSWQNEIRAKSVVIPNGIDDVFFGGKPNGAKTPHDPFTIIHVGDIIHRKNILSTLAAVETLLAEGEKVRFMVVGPPKDASIVEALQGKAFVQIFPPCDCSGVVEHFRQADVLVMPSFHETFGIVYAEAMSQGVPVIYTRGQGFDGHFPEGEIGFSVSPYSPREIVDAVRRIKDNYHELSQRCLRQCKRFDWTAIAGTYEDIYGAIVGRGPK